MADDPSDIRPSNVIALRGSAQEGDDMFGPESFDRSQPMWFMNQDYQPCPEHDVVAGEYRFRYRPEYEGYFITRGLEGRSLVAISAELAIPFTIIRYWARRVKSLAVALDMSRQNCQMYWEGEGESRITQKSFNAAGWLKMMAVRFPDSWREIEPEAKVTALDPYGFEDKEDQEEALINADIIFERLMRLKDSKESG